MINRTPRALCAAAAAGGGRGVHPARAHRRQPAGATAAAVPSPALGTRGHVVPAFNTSQDQRAVEQTFEERLRDWAAGRGRVEWVLAAGTDAVAAVAALRGTPRFKASHVHGYHALRYYHPCVRGDVDTAHEDTWPTGLTPGFPERTAGEGVRAWQYTRTGAAAHTSPDPEATAAAIAFARDTGLLAGNPHVRQSLIAARFAANLIEDGAAEVRAVLDEGGAVPEALWLALWDACVRVAKDGSALARTAHTTDARERPRTHTARMCGRIVDDLPTPCPRVLYRRMIDALAHDQHVHEAVALLAAAARAGHIAHNELNLMHTTLVESADDTLWVREHVAAVFTAEGGAEAGGDDTAAAAAVLRATWRTAPASSASSVQAGGSVDEGLDASCAIPHRMGAAILRNAFRATDRSLAFWAFRRIPERAQRFGIPLHFLFATACPGEAGFDAAQAADVDRAQAMLVASVRENAHHTRMMQLQFILAGDVRKSRHMEVAEALLARIEREAPEVDIAKYKRALERAAAGRRRFEDPGPRGPGAPSPSTAADTSVRDEQVAYLRAFVQEVKAAELRHHDSAGGDPHLRAKLVRVAAIVADGEHAFCVDTDLTTSVAAALFAAIALMANYTNAPTAAAATPARSSHQAAAVVLAALRMRLATDVARLSPMAVRALLRAVNSNQALLTRDGTAVFYVEVVQRLNALLPQGDANLVRLAALFISRVMRADGTYGFRLERAPGLREVLFVTVQRLAERAANQGVGVKEVLAVVTAYAAVPAEGALRLRVLGSIESDCMLAAVRMLPLDPLVKLLAPLARLAVSGPSAEAAGPAARVLIDVLNRLCNTSGVSAVSLAACTAAQLVTVMRTARLLRFRAGPVASQVCEAIVVSNGELASNQLLFELALLADHCEAPPPELPHAYTAAAAAMRMHAREQRAAADASTASGPFGLVGPDALKERRDAVVTSRTHHLHTTGAIREMAEVGGDRTAAATASTEPTRAPAGPTANPWDLLGRVEGEGVRDVAGGGDVPTDEWEALIAQTQAGAGGGDALPDAAADAGGSGVVAMAAGGAGGSGGGSGEETAERHRRRRGKSVPTLPTLLYLLSRADLSKGDPHRLGVPAAFEDVADTLDEYSVFEYVLLILAGRGFALPMNTLLPRIEAAAVELLERTKVDAATAVLFLSALVAVRRVPPPDVLNGVAIQLGGALPGADVGGARATPSTHIAVGAFAALAELAAAQPRVLTDTSLGAAVTAWLRSGFPAAQLSLDQAAMVLCALARLPNSPERRAITKAILPCVARAIDDVVDMKEFARPARDPSWSVVASVAALCRLDDDIEVMGDAVRRFLAWRGGALGPHDALGILCALLARGRRVADPLALVRQLLGHGDAAQQRWAADIHTVAYNVALGAACAVFPKGIRHDKAIRGYLDTALRPFRRKPHDFTPAQLAGVASGIAACGLLRPNALHAVVEHFTAHLQQWESVDDVLRLLWALCACGHSRSGELCRRAAGRLQLRFREFTPQQTTVLFVCFALAREFPDVAVVYFERNPVDVRTLDTAHRAALAAALARCDAAGLAAHARHAQAAASRGAAAVSGDPFDPAFGRTLFAMAPPPAPLPSAAAQYLALTLHGGAVAGRRAAAKAA